ncbi:MAG TPA: SIMPL domain-containing protein [Terracidiphilus sp.]|jgi:hypothetical protein
MIRTKLFAALAVPALCLPLLAQQPGQVQLKIDSSNRTLTVNAEERVTVEPDIAILHIGFLTPPSDAKSAYAAGAKTSTQIIDALKQAGIAEKSIRSESQSLESFDPKARKFRLQQSWVVRVPPARVAEILDIAVNAGATESGDIEWNVEDEKALENKALEQAAARARSQASVLAGGMGVKLGALVYVTNQISDQGVRPRYAAMNFAAGQAAEKAAPPPLAIEPHKVSRTANIYAVYSID